MSIDKEITIREESLTHATAFSLLMLRESRLEAYVRVGILNIIATIHSQKLLKNALSSTMSEAIVVLPKKELTKMCRLSSDSK